MMIPFQRRLSPYHRLILISIVLYFSSINVLYVHGQGATPRPSPTPATCNVLAYEDIWKYEADDNNILAKMAACKNQIMALTQQPFGPPSAYEVMTTICKGPCRVYYHRYDRMYRAEQTTGCDCKTRKPRCPKSPLDMLCTITGLCYDTEFYWEAVCDPSACGRYILNEKDYRGARNRCKLSLDSAPHSVIFMQTFIFGTVILISLWTTWFR